MSVNGIGGAPNRVGTALEDLRPRVEQTTPERGPTRVAGIASAPSQATVKPTALPLDPPPGTDPELWSVLTAEERAFFARAGAMGPLTYGRAIAQPSAAHSPLLRGGRLDVKA
jgi:hypothetical protein